MDKDLYVITEKYLVPKKAGCDAREGENTTPPRETSAEKAEQKLPTRIVYSITTSLTTHLPDLSFFQPCTITSHPADFTRGYVSNPLILFILADIFP